MRLIDLSLERWGPFTDRLLAFDPAADLVIVHGRNEAGKTSALAGLVDALYGIEPRSRFNFLHDYADMRVGATLANTTGERLVFRRRKGNRATLRDAAGEPLNDDALRPFLGGVDRSLFLTSFGLDQDALRAGGRELARGEGALGAALAAAAPGLGRLVALRRTLADEAAGLFSERRSQGKPFYVATDAWQSARSRLAASSLSADAIARAERAVADADATVTRLDGARRDARARLAAKERLARALPRLAEIDRLVRALEGRFARPAVDAAFAAAVGDLGLRRERIAGERRGLAAEAETLAASLATLRPDAALLASAAAVDRLLAGLSRRLAAADDRAECAAAMARSGPALDEAARRLGYPDAAALPAARPSHPAAARIRAMARERAAHEARAADLDKRRRALVDELGILRQDETPEGRNLEDPKGLKAQFMDLAPLLPAIRAADVAAETAARATGTADAAAAALRDAGLDPAGDPAARLPTRADIEAAARAIEMSDRTAAEAARIADAAAARAEDAARRRDRLAAGELPTPATLVARRAERDAAWARVRSLLFDAGSGSAVERHEAARDLERTIEAADRLSDRRTEAAEAVAALVAATEQAEASATDAARLRAAADVAAAEARRIAAAFDARLAPTGLAGRPPAAILALHDMCDALAARREAAETAAREHRIARGEVDRLAAALARLAGAAGVTATDDEPPILLLSRVRSAIEQREAVWAGLRDRERARADVERRLREADIERDAHAEARTTLEESWAEALAVLSLRADARPEEAEAAVSIWLEVAALEARRGDDLVRIERLDAELAAFDAAARRLAEDFALPPETTAVDVVGDLGRRLAEARRTANARSAAEERLAAVTARLAALDRDLADVSVEESRLRATAEIDADADLAAAVAEAMTTADLMRRLSEARAGVEADGTAESDLRAQAATTDLDTINAEIALQHEEIARLDADVNVAVAERTRAEQALAEIAARDDAVAAGQAVENALADALDVAERWRTIQAAARLAGTIIEEYRRNHQNPVLVEATRLFATISAGRYPELVADYDEDGEARLVALRDDGRRLMPDALSEGTKDQLFLALRLATLIDHATRAEPLPFIGDDLFVTFDEPRTEAALEALADAGRRFQCILFTHHEHVVTAAETRLSGRAQVLRL